ncbi:MAG: nucleotidyltransferase [Bacillota bacterium]|nr:nucleotidyltransferase [Bacillota bacterium]
MKTVGIVSEFNPFHNGHKYLIDSVIDKLNPDVIIIIMSGNFVQRGEPALIDKWARSKSALLNGANLIIELPIAYATQNADLFSKGSISILDKLGIDYLCFGTESKDLEPLLSIRDYIYTDDFKKSLSKHLNLGNSYPKAYDLSLQSKFPSEELLKSNNILALEYLKKLKDLDSNILPFNIQRVGGDYKSTEIRKDYSSATAIRKAVLKDNVLSIKNSVPEESYKELTKYIKDYSNYNSLDLFYEKIKHLIIVKGPKDLKKIYDISEGLHNRIYNLIEESENVTELIENISTKRYTYSKISRILTNILLDLTVDFYKNIDINNLTYLNVLASDIYGFKFLKENNSFNFITKYSDYKRINKTKTDKLIFEKTKKAGDIYFSSLMVKNYMNSEYLKNPYIKI